MPFIGLGLHVLVALFFAVHAIRNRQEMYWLIVLFSFPLLGSIVYFVAVYLPASRLERGARQALSAAVQTIDPGRALREARSAHAYAPTAQTQMRLAEALLEAGEADEAASQYEACLKGPFAADPESHPWSSNVLFCRLIHSWFGVASFATYRSSQPSPL